MACKERIRSYTNDGKLKCYLKLHVAEGRISNRISEWLVQGKSIKDLTLAQMMQKRSDAARTQEPLAHAEIPGFHVEWSTLRQQTLARQGYAQIRAANQFCLEHA